MQRTESSSSLPLGSKLPAFKLKNVDGRMLDQSYLNGRANLVGFLCNHCPYVKGSEEMLIEIVRRFEPQGLRAVTINSNDALTYPEDSFEMMQTKAREMNLPYPYLHDETQNVACLFDAACTPEFYLFDSSGTLVYHGTINDSPRDPAKVKQDYLSAAIAAILQAKQPDPAFVHPLGCSIKWKR